MKKAVSLKKINLMETTSLLLHRYSPFAFSDKEIPDALLQKFLEAARWAPSSNNEQPWRFLIVSKKNEPEHEKLFACLNPTNQLWAITAPVLMLVMAKRNYTRNNSPNYTHMFDTGMAMQNFILSALESNVYVHQMGGFSKEMARQNFAISEEYSVISVAAMGYLGTISLLPERIQEKTKRPRTRKPVEEILFQV